MAVICRMYPTDTPTINCFVSCHKSIHMMVSLPYRTHSCLFHLIINDLTVDEQIHLRIIKFINCMHTNTNNMMSLYVVDWQQMVVGRLCSAVLILYVINIRFVS